MSKRVDLHELDNVQFGELTVIGFDHYKGTKIYYKCKCSCGNIVCIYRYHLITNHVKTCGNSIHRLKNDILNKRFGKLIVVEYSHSENGHSFYKCICDCGNEAIIRRCCLVTGNNVSCGHCLDNCELYKKFKGTYYGMKDRCYNSKNISFNRYGNRGIKVCDRWLESFENFKEDMYDSYVNHVNKYGVSNTTIDRNNNDGNYEPNNCSWKTYEEQCYNKSTTRKISAFGEENLSVREAYNKYALDGITYRAVFDRIKHGISPEVALTAKMNTNFNNTKKFYNYNEYDCIEFF